MDGQGSERAHGVGDHVIAVEVACDFAVGFVFGDFGVTDEVPWAGGDEAEGFDAVAGVWEEDIAGELFGDEAGVGFVGIEGADDVVAVGPCVRARLVLVVAVGVAVVDGVEPVAGPAFAVLGAGEETVGECGGGGVRVGVEGGDEDGGFGVGGREAGEVVGEPADEGARVGWGSWRGGGEGGADEVVDWVGGEGSGSGDGEERPPWLGGGWGGGCGWEREEEGGGQRSGEHGDS